MSDSARDVIAEVVAAHQQADEYGYPVEECRCGESFPQDYADHLAAEIDTALGGLTRQTLLLNQYAAANGAPEQRQYRWASDWADS